MVRLMLSLIFLYSCSQNEVVKDTCNAKFEKLETNNFVGVSDRELASHDNDIRLFNFDYGKKHFREIKEIERSDVSCFAKSLESFSFSKAVLNEIHRYPPARQKKLIKDFKEYVKFRVDAKDNTLEHNKYLFGLLRKASQKGYLSKRRNRIILKMRELLNKWDQIKGIKDPKTAKLQLEILYQVSRGDILEIVENG